MKLTNYFVNFLVSIDQLGNVIAGGDPDNTISARVGYYTEEYYKDKKIPMKWRILRNIINFTFYPIDGKGHCKEAYFNDIGEKRDEAISDIAIAILTILIFISCFILSLFFYSLYALGLVSPKYINRTKNIKQRLSMANAKLQGVHKELNEYKINIDDELDEIIDTMNLQIDEITDKIKGVINFHERLNKFKLNKEMKRSKK